MSRIKGYADLTWFNADFSTPIEKIKRRYTELAKEHHPDLGGDTETMQRINAEWDFLKTHNFNIHENMKGETYTDERQDAPDNVTADFERIISELFRMGVTEIEVCGKFIWISGDTRPLRDKLKAAGFRWSANKQRWYKAPDGYRRYHKRAWSMDEIRSAYGSYRVERPARKDSELATA